MQVSCSRYYQALYPHARDYSLMDKRIANIQKELIKLNDHMDYFNFLTKLHIWVYYRSAQLPSNETFKCSHAAFGIIQKNLFEHKLYRDIVGIDAFESELQDEEEGVFYVSLEGEDFVEGGDIRFQGHDFIIIKIIEENYTSYVIAQSFVKKYSLKTFISENRMIYKSYDQLNENILTPLKVLLELKGEWTEKESKAYFHLTWVSQDWLIGYSHPDGRIKTNFGRSSNVPKESPRSMPLARYVDGKFIIPEDEWEKSARE